MIIIFFSLNSLVCCSLSYLSEKVRFSCDLIERNGGSLILPLIPIWILPDLCFPSGQKSDQRRDRACLERCIPSTLIGPFRIVLFQWNQSFLPVICIRAKISRTAGPASENCSERLLTKFLQICDWLRDFREPPLLLVCSSGRESNFPKLLLNYYYELLHLVTAIIVILGHHLLQLIIQTEFAHPYWVI